jgi:hypothetical protein
MNFDDLVHTGHINANTANRVLEGENEQLLPLMGPAEDRDVHGAMQGQ